MKTVCLFSGQGSQSPGMGLELCAASPNAEKVFSAASSILGYDLKEKCRTAPPEELSQTLLAQPAIMAVSLSACEAAKEKGLEFSAAAGHSLGEYAALVETGMVSLEDGFRLIQARASAMQKAAASHPGAMCAVMGLSPQQVEEGCRESGGGAVPVNYNSPAQTVIAGTEEAVKAAMETLAQKGAKTIRLAVSAAFHCSLMESAAREFYEAAKAIPFQAPETAFYSNVLGGRLEDFTDMPSLLAKHIVSPVRFCSELEALQSAGYDHFVECGPGKVLTGLVKKTLKGVRADNISVPADLEKALAE